MTAKKTAATKAAAKSAETKATEVKATVDTKTAKAANDEVKAEVKEEAVKAETKKVTTKTEVKKPAAKRTTAKKTVAKKPEVTRQMFVQFGGHEIAAADIMNKVEAAWAAMGNKAEDMTDVKVYIKPEEFMAYYVINGDVTGGVEM